MEFANSVMDYAETRRKEVLAVAGAMLRAPAGHRVRLVLLARGQGEWWDHLAEGATDPMLRAFLRSTDAVQGPLSLPRLDTDDTTKRAALYDNAQNAFRDALKDHATLVDPPASMPDLSAPPFRQVLFLHLAALAALHGRSLQDEDELLDAALDRERDYWKRSLDDDGLDPGVLDGVAQAMAMLTLVNGTSTARDARAVVAATPRLNGMTDLERNRLFDRLHALYPRSGGIDGLRPDLLGEHLVRRALKRDDEILDRVLDVKVHPDWGAPALTVLTRLAQRGDEQWLRRALRPEALSIPFVERAMEVAVEVGDPLGVELGNAIDQAEPRVWTGIVNHVWPKLPDETIALSNFSEVVCRRKIEIIERKRNLKKSGNNGEYISSHLRHANRVFLNGDAKLALHICNKALDIFNSSSDISVKGNQHFKADILVSFSLYYSGIGTFDEALEAAERAEEIYRELAAACPDVYQANWATSLSNLGKYLNDVGRHDEALEKAERAEEIRRELAAARPDAHRVDWATSLSNLGNHLSDVGRHDEALEKVERAEEIRRELAAARPDAHRVSWLISLGNQETILLRLGHATDAQSAAQRATDLFAELPDYLHRCHAPTLGWCTTILADSLLAQGAVGPAARMADMALTVFAGAGTMRPGEVEPNKAVAMAIRSRQPGLERSEAERMAREALDLIAPHARRRGRGLWWELNHVATALRAATPPGVADPVPPDLAAILDAWRPVTAPA